ncbi:hypothetical protein AAMO2058_000549800 [Amorphochlora amoebiformis]
MYRPIPTPSSRRSVISDSRSMLVRVACAFGLVAVVALCTIRGSNLQAPIRSQKIGGVNRASRAGLRNLKLPGAYFEGAAPVNTKGSMTETYQRSLDTLGANFHKKISILGSTGSIGTQTLEIVDTHPDKFKVVGLAAGSNVQVLADQIAKYNPEIISVLDASKVDELKTILSAKGVKKLPEILTGPEGAVEVAKYGDAETVVTGIVGCAGLLPTIAAIKAGKDIALANKETLISGGPVILPLLKEYDTKCIPADSEHSAIFQSIQGDLHKVKLEDALKHPNWAMGAKITIDSATLMNKGLEVIEAHYLFGTPYDDIDIVIHPQSIIHSMIETSDTSVIAQLGWPDMKLPILYSITWPYRMPMPWESLDLIKLGQLTFKAPDNKKYPCMDLAYAAGRTGGSMTTALNAANEQAVEMFRQHKIGYLDIPKVIESVMEGHKNEVVNKPSLDDILNTDNWAREFAETYKSTELVV